MSENLVAAKAIMVEKRYDLETCPGGWVKLRRFKHGESSARTDQAMTFTGGEEGGQANLSTRRIRLFDFAKAIVDHNLSDGQRKYDFTKPADVDDLESAIGDEIARLIEKHNEVLTVGDIPNSDPT